MKVTKDMSIDGTEHIYFYLKDEEHGWLSNFWRSPFVAMGGRHFETVEHFYQACKTSDDEIFVWIATAPKPYLAMKAGRNLREKDGFDKEEWDARKDSLMKYALTCKFEQNAELKEKLLNTGNAILHEDSPTDEYWGFVGGKGEDRLGKLLMEVREELRNER